jgi:putative aldouronate transport system permease protein
LSMNVRVVKMEERKPARIKSLSSILFNERTFLLYMSLPFVALLFIFCYLPLYGWVYSFSDSMPGPLSKMHFVGFELFRRMFTVGSTFLNSLRNTLALSILQLLTAPLSVMFALLLAEVRNSKMSRIIQTASSLPNFISWVLVYAIFFTFCSSQGFINTALINLKFIKEPLNILANDQIVWYFQTLVSVWKGLGWAAIIYIAALAGVDRELYDAAEVDGAGRFRKMIHVSLPGLLPTFFVMLLLSIGNILNGGFEQFYVFRNPNIINKIDVLDIYVYTQGITYMEFGYATAVGMAKSLVSIVLLFGVNFVSKKVRGQAII